MNEEKKKVKRSRGEKEGTRDSRQQIGPLEKKEGNVCTKDVHYLVRKRREGEKYSGGGGLWRVNRSQELNDSDGKDGGLKGAARTGKKTSAANRSFGQKSLERSMRAKGSLGRVAPPVRKQNRGGTVSRGPVGGGFSKTS